MTSLEKGRMTPARNIVSLLCLMRANRSSPLHFHLSTTLSHRKLTVHSPHADVVSVRSVRGKKITANYAFCPLYKMTSLDSGKDNATVGTTFA